MACWVRDHPDVHRGGVCELTVHRSPQHSRTLVSTSEVKLAQRSLGILSEVLLIGLEVCGDHLN